MKYLLFAFFLFASSKSYAQCFAIYAAQTYPDKIPVVNNLLRSQFLIPLTANDGVTTKEQCASFGRPTFWIEPVSSTSLPASEIEAIDNAKTTVVASIEDATLAIATSIACLCFFVGLNSWETSAK